MPSYEKSLQELNTRRTAWRNNTALRTLSVFFAVCVIAAGSACELILGPSVEIEVVESMGLSGLNYTKKAGGGGSFNPPWPTTVYESEFPLTLDLGVETGWHTSELVVDGVIHHLDSNTFTIDRTMFTGDGRHTLIAINVPEPATSPEKRAPIEKTGKYLSIADDPNSGTHRIVFNDNGSTQTLAETAYGILNVSAGERVLGDSLPLSNFAFENDSFETEYRSTYSSVPTVTFTDAREPTLATKSGHIMYRDSTGRLFVNTVENTDKHEILAEPGARYYYPSINDQNQGYRVLAVYNDKFGDGLYAELYSFNQSASAGVSLQQLRSIRIGESGDTPLPVAWDPTRIFAMFSARSGSSYVAMGLSPYGVAQNFDPGKWWAYIFQSLKFATMYTKIDSAMNGISFIDPFGPGRAASPALSNAEPYVWFHGETTPDNF